MGWELFGIRGWCSTYNDYGSRMNLKYYYYDGSGPCRQVSKIWKYHWASRPRKKCDANIGRRWHRPPPHLGMCYPISMHESVLRFRSIFHAWLAWQGVLCLLLSQLPLATGTTPQALPPILPSLQHLKPSGEPVYVYLFLPTTTKPSRAFRAIETSGWTPC